MRRLGVFMLLVLGVSTVATAFQVGPTAVPPHVAPEIDPSMAVAALTLLTGTAMIIRGRIKQ